MIYLVALMGLYIIVLTDRVNTLDKVVLHLAEKFDEEINNG